MKTKSLIFLSLFLISTGCFLVDDLCCDDCQDYIFHVPWQVADNEKAIALGDTLVIESVFDKMVIDQTFGDTFCLDNYMILPAIFLVKIDSSELNAIISEMFDTVEVQSPEYRLELSPFGTEEIFHLTYDYNNPSYSIQLKLVPKVKGRYALRIMDWVDLEYTVEEPNTFDGHCDKRLQHVYFTANGKQDLDADWDAIQEDLEKHIGLKQIFRTKEEFENSAGFVFDVL